MILPFLEVCKMTHDNLEVLSSSLKRRYNFHHKRLDDGNGYPDMILAPMETNILLAEILMELKRR